MEAVDAIEATGWCSVGLLLLASQCKDNGFASAPSRVRMDKATRNELVTKILEGSEKSSISDDQLESKLGEMLTVDGGTLPVKCWLSISEVWRSLSILKIDNVYIWEWCQEDNMYLLRAPYSGLSLPQYR